MPSWYQHSKEKQQKVLQHYRSRYKIFVLLAFNFCVWHVFIAIFNKMTLFFLFVIHVSM